MASCNSACVLAVLSAAWATRDTIRWVSIYCIHVHFSAFIVVGQAFVPPLVGRFCFLPVYGGILGHLCSWPNLVTANTACNSYRLLCQLWVYVASAEVNASQNARGRAGAQPVVLSL